MATPTNGIVTLTLGFTSSVGEGLKKGIMVELTLSPVEGGDLKRISLYLQSNLQQKLKAVEQAPGLKSSSLS